THVVVVTDDVVVAGNRGAVEVTSRGHGVIGGGNGVVVKVLGQHAVVPDALVDRLVDHGVVAVGVGIVVGDVLQLLDHAGVRVGPVVVVVPAVVVFRAVAFGVLDHRGVAQVVFARADQRDWVVFSHVRHRV